MATRQVTTRNLVGRKSLSFIRPQTIAWSVKGTKPNTRLYAFFDGVAVGQHVTPSGGSLGANIVTDSAGSVSGTFVLPAMTFNTGERLFKLQDNPTFDNNAVPGSLTGSASAKYTAIGMEETYQTTINTINQIEVTIWVPVPRPGGRDPLAQSFFTYGVTDGCFITKIDVFFKNKDTSIPITLELREMQNGYPSNVMVSKDASVTLAPSAVNLSDSSATATTFTFDRPIYLQENRDYCFVLLSNSNQYNVWTSKLGEKSIETSKTIFEQPFIGSLFKSENNITWTAEQTEDIKFTMYRANFSTGTSEIVWKANAYSVNVFGSNMSVTSGSPVVTMKLPFEHGHQNGDIAIFTGNGSAYRGIPNSAICDPAGLSLVVVDAFTLSFNVGTNATSTGTLESSGSLVEVAVDASGSGYVSPSISFSGGGGSGAAATANVSGGKIVSVTITNAGSGYTSTPALNLTDASGTGASLAPVVDAIFRVAVNRKFQAVTPSIALGIPPSTELSNTVRPSSESYVVGTEYVAPLNKKTHLRSKNVAVNSSVETTSFGSTNALEMITRLTTTNPNVSPMLDIGEGAYLRAHNYLVNGASNSASEAAATGGTAQARYISKPITVATLSKDVRVLVEAASVANTSFDVFIRTSVSGATTKHTDGTWTKLVCTTATNLSGTTDEFKDYEFRTSAALNPFDVYDIKIVLYSEDRAVFPVIENYRAIILAT